MEEMFEEATSFNQPLHAPWYAVEQSYQGAWSGWLKDFGA